MKEVYVRQPGTGIVTTVQLKPTAGATTRDLIRCLGLKRGDVMRIADGHLLEPQEDLYDVLDDGEKLTVVPWIDWVCSSVAPARETCPRLEHQDGQAEPVHDRQAKVPGFNQDVFRKLQVLLIGAGALGGEIAEGLTRKGVGRLAIVDFDVVRPSNLARQFFYESDIFQSKAISLVRNLQPHGYMGTELIGWPISFEEAVELELEDLQCDVVVCAVDDAQTRIAISRFALERGVPAVFSAVSEYADHGFVFVQEVDCACFGCALPEQVARGRTPCPGSPAIKDVMKAMAGVALYSIDTLFMERPRRWSLYDLSLVDGNANRFGTVERRPDCALCGDP